MGADQVRLLLPPPLPSSPPLQGMGRPSRAVPLLLLCLVVSHAIDVHALVHPGPEPGDRDDSKTVIKVQANPVVDLIFGPPETLRGHTEKVEFMCKGVVLFGVAILIVGLLGLLPMSTDWFGVGPGVMRS